MFKRMVFSLIGGVAFAAVLFAAPGVKAACDGWCADRTIYNGSTYNYSGCTLSYDQNHNVDGVTCYYSG